MGLEITARMIYPEFHGHLHSPSLTMGKKKEISFFYGFPTRVINQENNDDEDLPYVLIFGDSISEGYGHAFEDIFKFPKPVLRTRNHECQSPGRGP